jgi:hypothetical protein
MIPMVVFAIGDPVLFLSPYHSCGFFVLSWEKAMEFWHGGIHIRFCGSRLQKGGKGLVHRGMRDMCTYHSFLSCINY